MKMSLFCGKCVKGDSCQPVFTACMELSITLKAGVKLPGWLWGAVYLPVPGFIHNFTEINEILRMKSAELRIFKHPAPPLFMHVHSV